MVEAIIMTLDSIAFDSSLTNEFGLFELTAQKGKYIIQLRNIVTILIEKDVEVNKNINFGIIKVDNTTQLKEITIETKKKLIERKAAVSFLCVVNIHEVSV